MERNWKSSHTTFWDSENLGRLLALSYYHFKCFLAFQHLIRFVYLTMTTHNPRYMIHGFRLPNLTVPYWTHSWYVVWGGRKGVQKFRRANRDWKSSIMWAQNTLRLVYASSATRGEVNFGRKKGLYHAWRSSWMAPKRDRIVACFVCRNTRLPLFFSVHICLSRHSQTAPICLAVNVCQWL